MSRTPGIRIGDLVEFSDRYHQHYTMGGEHARYGVAVEAERPDMTVLVELAGGARVLARYVHAYAWSGWCPEELEETVARIRWGAKVAHDEDMAYDPDLDGGF